MLPASGGIIQLSHREQRHARRSYVLLQRAKCATLQLKMPVVPVRPVNVARLVSAETKSPAPILDLKEIVCGRQCHISILLGFNRPRSFGVHTANQQMQSTLFITLTSFW